MEFGGARKRMNPDAAFNGNGSFKKSKQEMESSTGIGSKSKPCTKFFSTSGCPFGEACHFLHHVPGGFKATAHMPSFGGGLPSHPPAGMRNPGPPQPFQEGPSPTVKSRLCKKYNSAEGCKFGDKCHFAHGEWELGRPSLPPSYEDPRTMRQQSVRYGGPHADPSPPGGFGASATAKISVDGSLAGAIIGKNGVNSKQICRLTGAKLSIREHESDPNLKNIELEGTFDQIKQASAMVRELIVNISSSASGPPHQHMRNQGMPGPGRPPVRNPAGNFKTKLCENFEKGTCTFGDRCHFAHGADEMRRPGV